MMSKLIEWLKTEQEINPVLATGIAHFQFVHIHPFLDDHGRSARLFSILSVFSRLAIITIEIALTIIGQFRRYAKITWI